MKKAIIILVFILAAVYVILAILGSRGEYNAERLLYQALKINNKVAMNPEVAPPALLASAERKLERIIKKYPAGNTAKTANLALAEFYITYKKYDQALAQLNIVSVKYPKDIGILSTAQFLKGITYERQGQWDKALREFNILKDKYPNTQMGIQAPLYIAAYYAKNGRNTEANQSFKDAASFYERMERANRGKAIGYAASALLVQSCLGTKDYEGAGKAVEDIITYYPSGPAFGQFLPYVEIIYVDKLNRPERAIEIYKNLKDKVKDEKFKQFLQDRIEKITEKTKSVSI